MIIVIKMEAKIAIPPSEGFEVLLQRTLMSFLLRIPSDFANPRSKNTVRRVKPMAPKKQNINFINNGIG
jgi:hypothetical protein